MVQFCFVLLAFLLFLVIHQMYILIFFFFFNFLCCQLGLAAFSLPPGLLGVSCNEALSLALDLMITVLALKGIS